MAPPLSYFGGLIAEPLHLFLHETVSISSADSAHMSAVYALLTWGNDKKQQTQLHPLGSDAADCFPFIVFRLQTAHLLPLLHPP